MQASPEYWQSFKLGSGEPDFGSFLTRQERFQAQRQERLERERTAPPSAPAGMAPGSRRMLAAAEQRRQREASQGEGGVQGPQAEGAPGSTAAALVSGLSSVVLGPSKPAVPAKVGVSAGAQAERMPSVQPRSPSTGGQRPGSAGSVRRAGGAALAAEQEFTYSPQITATAEVRPARSPEQMHADWEAKHRRLEARRAAVAAAEAAACPFRPTSVAVGAGRWAGVAPKVVPPDPRGWGRQLREREEAAVAAAASREQEELEACTFHPRVNERFRFDLGEIWAAAAVATAAPPSGAQSGGVSQGPRVLGGLLEPEEDTSQEEEARVQPHSAGGAAFDTAAAQVKAEQGTLPLAAAWGAEGQAPSGPAPVAHGTGSGGQRMTFASYLGRVKFELAALQAAAPAVASANSADRQR